MSADNPHQARWTQLRPVVDERLAIARETESITRAERAAAVMSGLDGEPGRALERGHLTVTTLLQPRDTMQMTK